MSQLKLFDYLRTKGYKGIIVIWSSGMIEAVGTNQWREHGPALNDNEAKS